MVKNLFPMFIWWGFKTMLKIRPFKHIRDGWRPRWSDAAYLLVATGVSVGLLQVKMIAYPAATAAIAHVIIKRPDIDIQAELKAFRAPELALKIINDLDLAHNPDFLNAAVADNSLLGASRRLLASSGFLASASLDVDLISKWSQVVHIQLKPDARALDIVATVTTPTLAKSIADATAERFSKEPALTAKSALATSSVQIDTLRADLAQAEAERDASRPSAVSLVEEQAALQLKERAKKIKGLVAQGLIFDAADALDTPSLHMLGDQRRQIVAELQVKGRALLDQHPVMKDLNSRLQVVEVQIRNATARAVQMLDADLANSRAQASKKGQSAFANAEQSPLILQLEQRVVELRQRLQDELQKMTVVDAVEPATYRVFAPADPPSLATPANLLGQWTAAAAFGALAGCLMAAASRVFGNSKHSNTVPVEARLKPRSKFPYFLPSPDIQPAETGSHMTLSAIFEDLNQTQRPSVVLLHGVDIEAIDAELSRQSSDKSVLLVELNGRASGRRRHGLGDLLNGSCQFDEVIHRQEAGYDVLPAGRQSTRRLGVGLVIATLSEAFDLIVLTDLDVASNDLDLVSSSLTHAILVDRPDLDEDNWQIEACLAQEPNCIIHQPDMPFRTFDHIVIAGHNLDALRDFYARIGFQVGHRNIHPWGTENHIVQFDGTFLELIGLPSEGRALAGPTPYFAEFVRDYLAKREGLAMLVLASANAQADFDDFAQHNISGGPLFDFARTARRPDGQEIRVAFTLAFAKPSVPMLSGFFTCQQHFPENFWNKNFQIHKNGAINLREVLFVSSQLHLDVDFFTAFSGVNAAVEQPELSAFGNTTQRILLGSCHALAAEYGIELPQDVTQMAALHFSIGDMANFALHLDKNAVRFIRYRDRILVAGEQAFGVCLIFSQG
eukprot:gene6296-6368_t